MTVIVGWLLVAAVVGAFAWALARAAAVGDEHEAERIRTALGSQERRTGPPERRASARPWAEAAPGRRQEDELRRERVDAEQVVQDAQARLAEAESRLAQAYIREAGGAA